LTEVATGRYLAPDEFEGEEEDLEDEALIINEHHILDIAEVVRQNIWLALPMYPSCIWSGPGECPNFVTYRQELEESQVEAAEATGLGGENEESIDPRWSALLALRRRSDLEE
jgi:uncharacterized metal-binding protein YceD (DUF177 family)